MTTSCMNVGLFRNPPLLRSVSTERYADALGAGLTSLGRDGIRFEHVAPSSSQALESALRVPVLRRLAGQTIRFPDSMLRARRTSFAVNHVLDHAYAQLVFVLGRSNTVVTCHDIFPLKLWRGEIDGLPRRRVPPLGFRLSLVALARSAAVVVPSEATRRDLVDVLGIAPDRIHVIPHGVDPAFSPDAARLHDPLPGRTGRLVLTVDTGCAYKNPAAAVRLLSSLAANLAEDVSLVRVGSPLGEAERRLAAELGVSDRIVELGFVDGETLPSLYARCDLLFFPSFYEGFGMPVLEAMASGTPVVCSTWPSLLEIAGSAALTAAPEDDAALSRHVVAILQRPEVAASLVAAGLHRAAAFTWRRAAERTLDVYENVSGIRLRRRPRLEAA